MGLVSFLIPDLDRLCPYSVETCHFVGFDGVPWQATASLNGNILRVTTTDEDSAKFVIPWRVDSIGSLALSTGTLKGREAAFHLPLELARGTLYRLRQSIARWRQLGHSPSGELRGQVAASTAAFIHAATSQDKPESAADAANTSITISSQAINALISSFTQFRWHGTTPLPKVWIGHEMHDGFVDDPRTNVAGIAVPWNQLEPNTDDFQWSVTDALFETCRERRLRVMCGPLIDLRPSALPDWIYLWQDDIEALESFVCRYVAEVVRRFRDRVHIWNCAVAQNTGAALNLDEESRLRLTVRGIETIRAHDQSTPLLLCVDQPWGEYLVNEEMDLSPFQFADMLARADIGVSGFALSIRIGASCADTLARDGLEFGVLVDRWSALGKPLVLMFDSVCDAECRTAATSTVVSFLRTKPAVQGIVFSDRVRKLDGK